MKRREDAQYATPARESPELRAWYASVGGKKATAFSGGRGSCLQCGGSMISKTGSGIYAPHWAHQSLTDCDRWHEPEGEWHRRWKLLVRPECCEVVMGEHRADIVGNGGIVIELQHSSISPAEIAAREAFYGRMIWIFDAEPFVDNLEFREQKYGFSFRWKHARKTHAACQRPVFWNFPDGRDTGCQTRLFQVHKVYDVSPVGGWGRWVDRRRFIKDYLCDVLRGNLANALCPATNAERGASAPEIPATFGT